MTICEMILYCDILFGCVLCESYLLLTKQKCSEDSRALSLAIRDLSRLSILRYLLSAELVKHFVNKRRSKWADIKKIRMRLFCHLPAYVVETIAPFLALYSLFLKMRELSFVNNDVLWDYSQFFKFLGFANQVAGLRVIETFEMDAIQRFVFSGVDAVLDEDTRFFVDTWYNIALLPSVSSLGLNIFDSMIFWNCLDPAKLQIFLKEREREVNTFESITIMDKANEHILDIYDKRVLKLLD
eukprot:24912_1